MRLVWFSRKHKHEKCSLGDVFILIKKIFFNNRLFYKKYFFYQKEAPPGANQASTNTGRAG
jgi:hypothetical protein